MLRQNHIWVRYSHNWTYNLTFFDQNVTCVTWEFSIYQLVKIWKCFLWWTLLMFDSGSSTSEPLLSWITGNAEMQGGFKYLGLFSEFFVWKVGAYVICHQVAKNVIWEWILANSRASTCLFLILSLYVPSVEVFKNVLGLCSPGMAHECVFGPPCISTVRSPETILYRPKKIS